MPTTILRGNIPILQRLTLGGSSARRLKLQATGDCSDLQSNQEGFVASPSCLNHILNADESPEREPREQSRDQCSTGVTYLEEILKFVRKLMQAGAVVRNGLPCVLKFFA